MMRKEEKTAIIEQYATHPGDTGSPEVQIAVLTSRINELTNPELQFRYCSKCVGNREYCQDHLFTHQHVK